MSQKWIDYDCSKTGYVNYQGDCNNGKRKYVGLDCTGFVSWAASMACGKSIGSSTINKFTKTSDYSKIETGDVLAGPGHVRLFIKKDGDKYIIAESSSGKARGVFFHKYDESTLKHEGYSIIKMKKALEDYCK